MTTSIKSDGILSELKKPFPVKQIHWRIGASNKRKNGGVASKGIALAYLDARDVMRRLDHVMGPYWQARYSHVGQHGTICEIGLKFDDEWIWRANGAGETDVEAEKGSMSDAFKRAAVLWGVGQYLYNLPNVWVDIGDYGKFQPPELPNWATPEGYDKIMASRQ